MLSRRALLGALGAALCMPLRAFAAEPDELKAVFLLRFLRYVEFPEPPESIRVCVIGAPEFAAALELVAAKLKEERPVKVEALDWSELRAEELSPCEVMYLRGEGSAAHSLINQTPQGTLVVGDTAGLIAVGAAIGFFWQNDKLRFVADQKNAEARGVRLGAELMRLAKAGR